jgi:hypothetical protein
MGQDIIKHWFHCQGRTIKNWKQLDLENIGRKVNLGFAFGTLKLADQAHLVLLDKKGNYGHQDDKKTTDEIQGQE